MRRIGAITAGFQEYRLAIIGMGPQFAAAAAPPLTRPGNKVHSPVDADGQDIVIVPFQGSIGPIMLEIGALRADIGGDGFAAFGMGADGPGQCEQGLCCG